MESTAAGKAVGSEAAEELSLRVPSFDANLLAVAAAREVGVPSAAEEQGMAHLEVVHGLTRFPRSEEFVMEEVSRTTPLRRLVEEIGHCDNLRVSYVEDAEFPLTIRGPGQAVLSVLRTALRLAVRLLAGAVEEGRKLTSDHVLLVGNLVQSAAWSVSQLEGLEAAGAQTA